MKAKLRQNYEKFIFLLVAIVVLLFTSQCSFLFSICDSVDANVFLMGGKLLLQGRLPYADFYDHKGIIVYLMHALSLMVFPNSFHGIYIIEIVATFYFYWYTYKIIKLIYKDLSNTQSIIYCIIGCTFTYVSTCMTYGDQVEEFVLPFISYFIYLIVEYLYENKFEKKTYFYVGLHIGLIFWAKYLCLLCHFLLFVSLLCVLIYRKEYKKIQTIIINIIVGFGIVTIPLLIYFIVTYTFTCMADIYFYMNIFEYNQQADTETTSGFFIKFIATNKYIMGFYLVGILLTLLKMKDALFYKIVVLTHLVAFVLLTFCTAWQYYYLPTFAFVPLEFVFCLNCFSKQIQYIVVMLCIICSVIMYFSNMTYHHFNLFTSKQKVIANIIQQQENSNMLVLCYDNGFYLAANKIPDNYYFMRICVKDNLIVYDYFDKIEKQQYDYIVFKQQGNKAHTDLDWNDARTQQQTKGIQDCGYDLIYMCDDVGRDAYTNQDSMVTLYKKRKK